MEKSEVHAWGWDAAQWQSPGLTSTRPRFDPQHPRKTCRHLYVMKKQGQNDYQSRKETSDGANLSD